MPENEKFFRNSFHGYNKDDVNSYISSLAEASKREADEAQTRLSRAERETENIKNELEIISRKADELAVEAYSASSSLAEKTEELRKVNAESAALHDKVESLEKALADCEEEKRTLLLDVNANEEKIEKLKSDYEKALSEEREKIYAELYGRIDEIIAAANENAESIIERAVDKSGKIIAEAESRAENIRNSAECEAKQMGENISRDCYDEFRKFASETRAGVDSLIKNIEDKGNEIKTRIGDTSAFAEERKCSDTSAKKDSKKSFDERFEAFFKNTIASFVNRGDTDKKG